MEQVIDDFNQMLEDYRSKEGHPLSEDKKSEYRDLRRRGKNRVSIITYQTTLLSLVKVLIVFHFLMEAYNILYYFRLQLETAEKKRSLKPVI